MKSLREMLKERALRASPDDQAWAQAQHAVVRAYFEGSVSDADLYQTLRGYNSFRLVGLTVPGSEEWSLLMTALDLLTDGVGDGLQVPLKRLSHGWITYDEYVETLAPPRRVEKKASHRW